MKIAIFGLGYVGAVSLACLGRDGHQVVGVDIDGNKLEMIRGGRAPIVEEGIQELMKETVDSGRVTVTSNTAEAVASSDVSFVCVGTPSAPNGSQDLTAIRRLSESIGDALSDCSHYHVVVIRSTVQPGTVESLIKPILEQRSGKRVGEGFGLGFQPEFLREGSSIKDYDNPPFTVVGMDSERSARALREIFGHLPCEFVSTDIGTAEMLKYACNSFHALKITFANEISRICQSVGVDGRRVMELVCRDRQLNISPAYMRPGFAFGGSCLPKDLRALTYVARSNDVSVPMLDNVLPSNRVHIEHAIGSVLARGRPKIGLIGLSFKSGTDDLRESPLVTLAETFIGKGLDLRIYDPEVSISSLIGANRRYIEESIPHIASLMVGRCEDLIDQSEVVVVGLNDAPIMTVLEQRTRPDQWILDLTSIKNPERLAGAYQGVCW